jgi:hypothetical protein
MKMMKIMMWIVSGLLCFGLVAAASPALASVDLGEAGGTGRIEARVQRTGLGNTLKSVVVYNQAGEVVAEKITSGERVSFSRLPVGRYHVVAYLDEVDEALEEDVAVLTNQTTRVAMQLKKPTDSCLPNQPKAVTKEVTCGNLSGEPSMVKVAPFYSTTVVYLQCGKVVEKVGPACGCRAGGWNYTTSCSKGDTIYVNLPCFRGGGKP